MSTWAKMIPYLRIENLEKRTLSRATYLYNIALAKRAL